MQRQKTDAEPSEAGYFLPLLFWLGALLAIRIAALVAARIDLVLDEAQYGPGLGCMGLFLRRQ
jgi:hypothetical protein